MKILQYKEETKFKIGAVLFGILLLYAYFLDGKSIFAGFEGMKHIFIYVFFRDILPAVFVILTGCFLLCRKISPKVTLYLLSGLFMAEFLGRFVLLSKEKVYFGFLLSAENIVKAAVNILAMIFTIMVANRAWKASQGTLWVTVLKGILILFGLNSLSAFLIASLVAAFSMFSLSGVEDYGEKPLTKLTGEKIGFARRNVGLGIILTILTLGIYGIIWLTKICKDLRRLHGDENPVGAEVLAVLFVPFYSVYWGYEKGKQMYEDSAKRGGNLTDRKYVYLFMNLLCMQLFTLGFIQTQLNGYQNR